MSDDIDIVNKKKADDTKKIKKTMTSEEVKYNKRYIDRGPVQQDIDRGQVQQNVHPQRSSTTMTSTEVKYNKDIDRGQVHQVHQND